LIWIEVPGIPYLLWHIEQQYRPDSEREVAGGKTDCFGPNTIRSVAADWTANSCDDGRLLTKSKFYDSCFYRSVFDPFWLGGHCRAQHAGMGLGAMDQLQPENLEGQFNFIVHRILICNGLGALCPLDYSLR